MGILKTASLIKMNKNITPPINPVKAGKFTTKKYFFVFKLLSLISIIFFTPAINDKKKNSDDTNASINNTIFGISISIM